MDLDNNISHTMHFRYPDENFLIADRLYNSLYFNILRANELFVKIEVQVEIYTILLINAAATKLAERYIKILNG